MPRNKTETQAAIKGGAAGGGGGGQRRSLRVVSGMVAAAVKNPEIKVDEIEIKVLPQDDGQDRSQEETVRGPEEAEDEKEEEPEQRQQPAAPDMQN